MTDFTNGQGVPDLEHCRWLQLASQHELRIEYHRMTGSQEAWIDQSYIPTSSKASTPRSVLTFSKVPFS